jgi:hypothetical protein
LNETVGTVKKSQAQIRGPHDRRDNFFVIGSYQPQRDVNIREQAAV